MFQNNDVNKRFKDVTKAVGGQTNGLVSEKGYNNF
jgi:hypothetical protein